MLNVAFRPPPRSSEPRTPKRLVDCTPENTVTAESVGASESCIPMPASAIPYMVTLVCAAAAPANAPSTASASRDFFIDQSPRFLEIDGLHAAAPPRTGQRPPPDRSWNLFSPNSPGRQRNPGCRRQDWRKFVAGLQQRVQQGEVVRRRRGAEARCSEPVADADREGLRV